MLQIYWYTLGQNPWYTLMQIIHNIMYFRISGKTGDSVLKFSLFAALHSQKIFDNENNSNISGKLLQIEDMYNKWISQVGISSDIKYEVSVFTLSEESFG